MYITKDSYGLLRNVKKTPQALILRGFSVEVAGFEPAAFWSRTIRPCSKINALIVFVHYAYITKRPGFPRGKLLFFLFFRQYLIIHIFDPDVKRALSFFVYTVEPKAVINQQGFNFIHGY